MHRNLSNFRKSKGFQKAQHRQDWISNTNIMSDHVPLGGIKGNPPHPQQYSILDDVHAQAYVHKILNIKGGQGRYLRNEIRTIEEKMYQRMQKERNLAI